MRSDPRCECCNQPFRRGCVIGYSCRCDEYTALPIGGYKGLVCQVKENGRRCFKCPTHDPHTAEERAEAEREFLGMLERLRHEGNV